MAIISYPETLKNETGPVPGKTWPWLVFGAIGAVVIGSALAHYFYPDFSTDISNQLRGSVD